MHIHLRSHLYDKDFRLQHESSALAVQELAFKKGYKHADKMLERRIRLNSLNLVNLKRIVFLTGSPGVGKTTVLMRTIEKLREKGFNIGGMVSREAREAGSRVGFRIVDLDTKREGWLAHVRQKRGPKIGKYRVCLDDLENIGVKAVLNAIEKTDIIVIDEAGPMELFSQAFREAVTEALKSEKTVLGTIHYRARNPLIAEIKNREDAAIIEVTRNNRERLPVLIVLEVSERLGKR